MSRPLTVPALERALRRRILSWGPGRARDLLARLREDVEHALETSVKVPAVDLDHRPRQLRDPRVLGDQVDDAFFDLQLAGDAK